MYFYFFSEYPAAVKFQGVYFGKIDSEVKFCNLTPPYPLTEICPFNGCGDALTFFPDRDFLNSPPPFVSVTDMKGGYMLRFEKRPANGDFCVITQKKFADATVTVFSENGFRLSLETAAGFHAEGLPFSPLSAEVMRGSGRTSDLIFARFNCEKAKILNVYSVRAPALILSLPASDFSLTNDGFKVSETLIDMAKHTITAVYTAVGDEITIKERTVTPSARFNRETLPEKLIPYAFAEEFACGGDYAFYLSDGVRQNADKLSGYLGRYIGVTTPPFFRDYREIGLVYKDAERKYRVEYFTFDVENQKIVNINRV